MRIALGGQRYLWGSLVRSENSAFGKVSRRDFLRGATVLAGSATAGPWLSVGTASADEALAVAPAGNEDRWLGPGFWANRLQDWGDPHRSDHVCGDQSAPWRTDGLGPDPQPERRPSLAESSDGYRDPGTGFSDFLVGAGEPGTDYRRAALVGEASGQAGGLLCVCGSDGRVVFRDHTDDQTQFTYPEIASTPSGPAPARALSEQVEFSLDGRRAPGGTLTLTLKAVNATTKEVLSQAILSGRTAASVAGGFALVSSGPSGTHWFRNLRSTWAGVQLNSE